MYGGEHRFAVFDVVQADQPPVLGDVAEVLLGAVVGSNAGGHDETGAATVGMDLQDGFGKQRVGVHVAHAGQRIAAAVDAFHMGKHAGCLRCAAGGNEFAVEAFFGLVFMHLVGQVGIQVARQHAFAEPLDALGAFGLVAGLRHVVVAGGEEFFLLQLDAFPRRIAQHAVEAALREYLRKCQRPVEHAGLLAGRACSGDGVGVLGLGAFRCGQ